MRKADLQLKALGQFYGTQQYYNVMGVNVTDGIKYIMDNGYSWFVTDAIAVIRFTRKLKDQPFLAVMLEQADREADLVITDGNDNELYRQHYKYTDAKRNLTLFYEYGVLLLNSEH